VTTTYTGGDADNARSQWSRNSSSYLQKTYTKFYTNQYPDIEVADTIQFKDNRDDNVVVIEEFYKIPGFWSARKDNGTVLVGTVRALSLETFITYSKSAKRTDPFNLSYPVDYKTIIKINYPDDWPTEPYSKNIDSDYYTYSLSTYGSGKTSYISTHYRTKQSYLPAEAHARYLADHEVMWNNLSFEFTHDSNIAAAGNNYWPGIVLGILVLCGSLYVMLRIYRDYNPTPYYPAAWAPPLGGWLILVGIGVTLTPCVHLYSILRFHDQINGTVWLSNFTAGNYGVAIINLCFQIYNVAVLPATILLAVLFYKRRSSFPRLLSIYLLVALIVTILNLASISYLNEPVHAAIGLLTKSFITAATWVPYFNMSQRVKRTFVFTYAGNSDPDETSDAIVADPVTETVEEQAIQPGEAIG